MALNAICTALSRLGFTNAVAVFITDQQGLDSLDEFCPIMDDEVKNLITVTHRPGGTIPNPAPVVTGALALPQIPNPGILPSLSTGRKQLEINVTFFGHNNGTNNYSSPSTCLV